MAAILKNCKDVAPPEIDGFLGCRATGCAVPLLVGALVRYGGTALAVEDMECLQKILEDYPESVCEECMHRWQQAEKARED